MSLEQQGNREAGNIQRRLRQAESRPEIGPMVEFEKQILELKKEVVEARNLVIKNDNILKNLHADLKTVLDRQRSFEKRTLWTSASAYLIFAALAGVGAYKYASSEIREKTEAAQTERLSRENAETKLKQKLEELDEAHAQSAQALELFQQLASGDEPKRQKVLTDIAKMDQKHLTDLEKLALKDKSLSLRIQAAQAAYENGRQAYNRRDYRAAVEQLKQYLTLASRPDDNAYNLLGNAFYQLRSYKEAVEPLRAYLKSGPPTKSAEYATILLGDSLASSGQAKDAIEVYRSGGAKFGASQSAQIMRARARRLEQAQKDAGSPQAQQ